MKVLITGGGTGGHVFPAIAIADALKAMDPSIDILFVGAEGKMEMKRVPAAGYPIEGLPVAGFHRKLTLKNLSFPFKLLRSLMKAQRIVKRFQPDVCVGVGGYASGPVLNVAGRRNIPYLIQEQNSHAGVTNQILSKKAAAICVAYDGMEQYFPKEKIVFTGNPVRGNMVELKVQADDAKAHFGFDTAKPLLVILGGSLGAKTLNEAMAANEDWLKRHPDLQVLWQVGSLYEVAFGESHTARLPQVKMVAFIDRMDMAYAAADILICRAGALTVSELCLVGKPVVLIPSPNVAEDHQTKNARSLVDKDAAWMVTDMEAKDKMLPEAWALLQNEPMKAKMAKAIKELARPNAAKTIAEAVMKLKKNK